jgi:hypothetical protein
MNCDDPHPFWPFGIVQNLFACIKYKVFNDCLAFILRVSKSKMILPNGEEIFNQRRNLKSQRFVMQKQNWEKKEISQNESYFFFWYEPRDIKDCITCVFTFMRQNSQG